MGRKIGMSGVPQGDCEKTEILRPWPAPGSKDAMTFVTI